MIDHALDRVQWLGETDLGSLTTTASRSNGVRMASYVNDQLRSLGLVVPKDSKYLGLAAGRSYAEMAFARLLRITPDNITLVDRDFGLDTAMRIKALSTKITLEQSGLFAYLVKQPNARFTFITALGIEYVLDNNRCLDELIDQAARTLTSPGMLSIYPYNGPNPIRRCRQRGLVELKGPLSPRKPLDEELIYLKP